MCLVLWPAPRPPGRRLRRQQPRDRRLRRRVWLLAGAPGRLTIRGRAAGHDRRLQQRQARHRGGPRLHAAAARQGRHRPAVAALTVLVAGRDPRRRRPQRVDPGHLEFVGRVEAVHLHGLLPVAVVVPHPDADELEELLAAVRAALVDQVLADRVALRVQDVHVPRVVLHAEENPQRDAAALVEHFATFHVVRVPLLVVLGKHRPALVGPPGHGLTEVVRQNRVCDLVRQYAVEQLPGLAEDVHLLGHHARPAVGAGPEGEGRGPAGLLQGDLHLQRALLRPARHLVAEPVERLLLAVVLGGLAELPGEFLGRGVHHEVLGGVSFAGRNRPDGEEQQDERKGGGPARRHSVGPPVPARAQPRPPRPVTSAVMASAGSGREARSGGRGSEKGARRPTSLGASQVYTQRPCHDEARCFRRRPRER